MPRKVFCEYELLSLVYTTIKDTYSLAESEIYKSCIKPKLLKGFSSAFVRENGVLFTGDSLKWLKGIRDESIDLIFADPPYNIKKQIGINLSHKKNIFNGLLIGLKRPHVF